MYDRGGGIDVDAQKARGQQACANNAHENREGGRVQGELLSGRSRLSWSEKSGVQH